VSQRIAAAVVLVAVAVAALAWAPHGEQLLLGAAGVAAIVRGATVLRSARAGRETGVVVRAAAVAVPVGLAAVFVALLSDAVSGGVLMVAAVLGPAAVAVPGPAASRRRAVAVAGGLALAVLVLGVGLLGGWDGAARAVTVLVALGLLALAGQSVLRARQLTALADRPAAPAGCGGCACAGGGCGSLSR
jgi:hypothetical protein